VEDSENAIPYEDSIKAAGSREKCGFLPLPLLVVLSR
jgi:hypothetical protein